MNNHNDLGLIQAKLKTLHPKCKPLEIEEFYFRAGQIAAKTDETDSFGWRALAILSTTALVLLGVLHIIRVIDDPGTIAEFRSQVSDHESDLESQEGELRAFSESVVGRSNETSSDLAVWNSIPFAPVIETDSSNPILVTPHTPNATLLIDLRREFGFF